MSSLSSRNSLVLCVHPKHFTSEPSSNVWICSWFSTSISETEPLLYPTAKIRSSGRQSSPRISTESLGGGCVHKFCQFSRWTIISPEKKTQSSVSYWADRNNGECGDLCGCCTQSSPFDCSISSISRWSRSFSLQYFASNSIAFWFVSLSPSLNQRRTIASDSREARKTTAFRLNVWTVLSVCVAAGEKARWTVSITSGLPSGMCAFVVAIFFVRLFDWFKCDFISKLAERILFEGRRAERALLSTLTFLIVPLQFVSEASTTWPWSHSSVT